MRVKQSVFASVSERKNYYKLSRQWGKDYHIYHNLPFLLVFDVNESDINSKDMSRLKKTSIDFTLSDMADKPIVCIEFDGLQQGVSIGKRYKPKKGFNNWRGIITALKLEIALQSNFPYIVVGDTEFEDVSSDTQLTIVDGILGSILASRLFHEYFHERDFEQFINDYYKLTPEAFAQLPGEDQQDIFDKFGVEAEVDADLDANPISKKVAQIKYQLLTKGLIKHPGFGSGSLHDDTITSAKAFVDTKQFGHIEKTIVLPRFEVPGVTPISLAINIAELLLYTKLEKLLKSDLGNAPEPPSHQESSC